MSPPWAGWIGSSPRRPVDWSTKLGLSPLVSRAKTQRTAWVDLPQAKLSWLGSAATFEFWQAWVISVCTWATLAGQLAPPPGSAITSARIAAQKTAAVIASARRWERTQRVRDRPAAGRPPLMSASVRPPGEGGGGLPASSPGTASGASGMAVFSSMVS